MEKDLKIQENQSIYDIANAKLGGFDNIYLGLIALNPVLTSIDLDLNTIASQTIKYDDLYYSNPTLQIQLNVTAPTNNYNYKALENQSIYDIALMKYGGLENIYDLIQSNDLFSINNTDISGKTFIFDKTKILNETLTKSISKKGYSFGSLVAFSKYVWDGEFIIWDGENKLIY